MKTLLAVMSIMVVFAYSGCGEHADISSPPVPLSGAALRDDPDIRELLSIRDEMTRRIFESGVSGREIADIIENDDFERFSKVLGYSENELQIIGKRISFLGTAVRERYPELKQIEDEKSGCSGCEFRKFAEKWDSDLKVDNQADVFLGDGEENQIPLPDPSDKGVTCQWLQYTAALAVCTTTGPVLYWACAYVAVCTFCSGGWTTTICL